MYINIINTMLVEIQNKINKNKNNHKAFETFLPKKRRGFSLMFEANKLKKKTKLKMLHLS